MSKRNRTAQLRRLCRFAGGDQPCDWRLLKSAEFISAAQSAGWIGYSHHRGPVMVPPTSMAPKRAKKNSGELWLWMFKDYPGDTCIIYPFRTEATPRGVLHFEGNRMPAHRAMCLMAHGHSKDETKTMALHSCGNGDLGCVNAKHLYWGNDADNAKDRVRHAKEGKLEVPVWQKAA